VATLDLELVPLRSKFPNTGHLTVRHAVPAIGPAASLDLIAEDVLDILDSLETTTTPQVVGAASASAGETTARKGVRAR
jgi:hypothetical protein